MRQAVAVIFTLCALTLLITSCKKTDKGTHVAAPIFSSQPPSSPGDTLKIREIYYGLMTPVEVCNIFDRLELSFNDTIVSEAENRDLYMSSYKAAMNLGVYGVDMGYMKLFGVNRQTVSYFNTIKTLSERLNMPDTFLSDAIRGVDRSMNNADSLTGLMNDAYMKIDNHLRLEESEGTLGLMLMGGWIEAMYLATQLAYDPANPDPQVVAKIAEQKYSLFYTKKLKYLSRWFDTFDIYFKPGDVSIDTLRQVITTSGTEMTVTVETINQIRDYIARLRTEITAV
jgi:hypothetical protein